MPCAFLVLLLINLIEMQLELEKLLTQDPEVDYVFSKTGTADIAFDAMPPNVSDTFIILKPHDQWPDPHLTKNAFISRIKSTLETSLAITMNLCNRLKCDLTSLWREFEVI